MFPNFTGLNTALRTFLEKIRKGMISFSTLTPMQIFTDVSDAVSNVISRYNLVSQTYVDSDGLFHDVTPTHQSSAVSAAAIQAEARISQMQAMTRTTVGGLIESQMDISRASVMELSESASEIIFKSGSFMILKCDARMIIAFPKRYTLNQLLRVFPEKWAATTATVKKYNMSIYLCTDVIAGEIHLVAEHPLDSSDDQSISTVYQVASNTYIKVHGKWVFTNYDNIVNGAQRNSDYADTRSDEYVTLIYDYTNAEPDEDSERGFEAYSVADAELGYHDDIRTSGGEIDIADVTADTAALIKSMVFPDSTYRDIIGQLSKV